MAVNRNRLPSGLWVPLRANYFMDPAIQAVGNQGELAYLRGLAVSKLSDGTGRIHRSNIVHIARRQRGWTDVEAALLEHKLWVSCADSDYIAIRSWPKHNRATVDEEETREQARVRQQLSRLARRDKTVIDVSQHVSHAPKRREERREEEERTPSGSVRSSSAPAAPRSAGGAAQPALDDENEGDRLSRDEAIALARAEIEKGRRKNPASRGTVPVTPQRNRPTEAITGPNSFAEIAAQFAALKAESEKRSRADE